ncbi:MAG: response regulator [Planctomycetes bacterium]|nr:response regulator [Planctomycetota bacterium]
MDRHRILVVDDDPGIRLAVSLKLRGAGYEVFQASDGVEALEFFESGSVDLAVLDVGMPRMDGYTVARTLHQRPATQAMPVVILTAQDIEIPTDVAPEIGPHHFLTKPFSPRKLVEVVIDLLDAAES